MTVKTHDKESIDNFDFGHACKHERDYKYSSVFVVWHVRCAQACAKWPWNVECHFFGKFHH